MKSLFWFATFVVAVFLGSKFAEAGIMYHLTDLGTLGGTDSRAIGINGLGDVVGWAFTPFDEIYHAYRYSNGSMQDLRPYDEEVNQARGLNNDGSVVGWTMSDGRLHATLWNNGTMTDLDPSGLRSSANSINANGVVTGDANFDGFQHAFRYEGGNLQDIGSLGGLASSGTDINASGNIVGYSYTASGHRHAFSSPASGLMQDLGTLGGGESFANGVNNAGVIVGWAMTENDRMEAFVSSGGIMHALGTLGGLSSIANGINNRGDIVGRFSDDRDGSDWLAFVTVNGTMIDLNSLIDPSTGWTLIEATAMNDSGQIVGFGLDKFGVDRGFLLTPIPTPTVFPVFLSASAFLARRSR